MSRRRTSATTSSGTDTHTHAYTYTHTHFHAHTPTHKHKTHTHTRMHNIHKHILSLSLSLSLFFSDTCTSLQGPAEVGVPLHEPPRRQGPVRPRVHHQRLQGRRLQPLRGHLGGREGAGREGTQSTSTPTLSAFPSLSLPLLISLVPLLTTCVSFLHSHSRVMTHLHAYTCMPPLQCLHNLTLQIRSWL